MTFRLLPISFTFLILLSTSINALRDRSLRVKRAVCPNPNGNACTFVSCENGGICQEDPGTLDCFLCVCPVGFTGKTCETSIPIPPVGCSPGCQNGGVCSVNICVCPSGYSGTLCEVRDYCLPTNPCQNGGRCTSNSLTFQCDCTGTGFTGTFCTDAIVTDPCAPNPCLNGGQCSSASGTANCLCANGYIGTFCQIPPVPCAATPCQNGGTCELLATNVYGCVCPPEFTGTQCENSILVTHPCVTMPAQVCRNGATCTVNDADYICICAVGWSGRNCEIQGAINTCTPNPCVHGTCTEVLVGAVTAPYCTCDNGWTGQMCDVDLNGGCTVGYCLSGGTCQLSGNVPYCQCPASYTGVRCETYIGAITTTTPATPTCTPNPCMNGGSCFNNGNSFVCACLPSWTGPQCSTAIGVITTTTLAPGVAPCNSNPCMNGGSCFNNGNSFVCACLPSWTGPQCSTAIGVITTTTLAPGVVPCNSNPCMNGGSCFNNGNSFICGCLPSWTGSQCTISTGVIISTTLAPNTGFCTNQSCRNGGTCLTVNNSYYCQCTSAYTGANCEAVIVPNCPLNCAPGVCTLSGNSASPYVCACYGTFKLKSCV